MPNLPDGALTFLFTDIEGSTRLWEQHPQAAHEALDRHDALLRQAIEAQGGSVFKTMGDAFCAAFTQPLTALLAAVAAQRALQSEPLGEIGPLRVRMALNSGVAQAREGDYFGAPLNRVARLLDAGHGGQILLSQVTTDQIRDHLPSPMALRDLGAHRLKDLQRSEHLFQLLHPDLLAAFPPLRSLEAFAHNLPRQLTSFIGREREMATVKQLLREVPLLTLTGPGGCGKTRLALQVAADLVEEFPDGVWLVELAALSDPNLVPQAVRSALGIREGHGQPLEATLTDYLRRRSLLLVLDNCEHLLTASAQLAETLLQSCPQLHILVSSRERLGISGEQTYSVPSLSLPDPEHLDSLERLHEFEAVRLFTDRAVLSQSTFTLTAANAAPVAQICQRLDGIPLAIELAAARVKTLTVGVIYERLDDRFRLLTVGSRTALPRQQTLRALIDWSYDLLSEPERTLLRRLSLFVSGCTLEAAEVACSGADVAEWEVLDLLTALVEKSLVLFDEQSGAPRYALLETVRQYGLDALQAAGELAWMHDRHRAYFLRRVEAMEPQLNGPEQAAVFEELDQEHGNIRTVLAWSLGEGSSVETGLRMAKTLGVFWSQRGLWAEGRSWLERMLEQASNEPTALRSGAIGAARALVWQSGDVAGAQALDEEWLALSRAVGDQPGVAYALRGLASDAAERGDFAKAGKLLEESLAIFRELESTQGMRSVLNSLGALAELQGEYDRAFTLYTEGLALSQKLCDPAGIANCTWNLGAAERNRGNLETAQKLFTTSLEMSRELGNSWGVAASLHFLGVTAQARGNHTRAWALLTESLPLYQQMGHRRGIGLCLTSLAEEIRQSGWPERAAMLLAAAERCHTSMGRPLIPVDRAHHDHIVAAVRAMLASETFAEAWAHGEQLTLEEAVAVALEGEAGPEVERSLYD